MTLNFDVARAVIIGALADNYVDLKNPTTNQNAAGTRLLLARKMPVMTSSGRFSVSIFPGFPEPSIQPCSERAFRAEGNSALGRTHDVHRVTATWTDTSINWNNQPGVAGSPTNSQTVTAARTYMRWTVDQRCCSVRSRPVQQFRLARE